MKKFTIFTLAFLTTFTFGFASCGKNDVLKEKYSKIYADVSQEMLDIASKPASITAMAMKPAEDMEHVASTGAFLYFVSELYKNDAFLVSDKPVLFTCSYAEYGDTYNLAFRPVLDEENQKVLGEFYVETQNEKENYHSYDYIYIDVDYDFDKKEILAFDLYMCEWDSAENVLRSLYQNGVLQELEDVIDEAYTEAKAKVQKEMAEFKIDLEDAVDLKHDFTQEYTASMNALFQE